MAKLFEPGTEHLALTNPISADMSLMRRSLWPGLVTALSGNVRRQQDRVRLFEVGTRFMVNGGALEERMALAGLAWGAALPEQWGSPRREVDFHDVKGELDALFALSGRQSSIRYRAATLACLHPGRSARIEDGSTALGWIGELHPALCRTFDLRQAPILFELDFSSSFMLQIPVYKEISKFPTIRRDLAVVVDERVTLQEIRENVRISAAGLLHELRVFDIYRGKGIEAGRKSIALGLILQDSSRTLTDTDADGVMTAVVTGLKNEQNATIRD
jgi:phenylalanyl-tRNA synthetase beta chain